MGGIMLAYGVLAALMARERTGAGQAVDASHLGSMAILQGLSLSMRLMLGGAMPRVARKAATNPLWNHYRCQDDKWLALAMLQPQRYWPDLVRALGLPEMADDERYQSLPGLAANGPEIVAAFDGAFATRPRAEWIEHLKKSPGDFIFTIVNSVQDLPDDPQMRANDYIVEFDHPQHGPTEMLGLPVRLSETPGSIRMPAPELGQHTEEVLLDVLGWDWDRISTLREKEAI
jgi:crotonobetainyl-CoA:carnitine CoA-transferase CaiB-like acyl-CoA transferase